MELTYLNISKSEIPCEKIFLINGTEYAFLFMYNDLFDFFTVTIKNMSGEIILSNKLSYMRNALSPVVEGITNVRLIPISLAEFESGEAVHKRISTTNFDNVRITIL